MYILLAILAFGFLILIHELGHYIAARIFHVTIYEFAIGMGPRLISYQSKKTGIVYALRMIPLGGFVSMEGELSEGEELPPPETDEEKLRAERIAADPKLGALASKAHWKRLIVHAAGATVNLIFGFLAAIILTIATPEGQIGGTTVSRFDVPKDAEMAYSQSQGLMIGDEILEVNGTNVYIPEQLHYEIMHEGGTSEPLTLTIRRNGEIIERKIHFGILTESGQKFGSIDFYVAPIEKTFGAVFKQSFFKCTYMVNLVWDSLIDLVTGRYSMEAVSGPVGTASVMSDAAKQSISTFFFLVALISVNLGIFNLLPLPALDGGHLLYTLIELISRKKLPPRVIGIIDTVGFVILFGFMLFVTGKDIIGLF